MSPDDIKTLFENIVDDSFDATSTEVLMDMAYTQVNEERPWAFLLKLDTSITHSPGNTWLTTKTLPSDFARSYKAYGGASDNEYEPIPFERALQYVNANNKFTIDMANLQMRLFGSPSSALTMYFWYLYAPTSLIGLSSAQKASTSTIVWPKRFCPILAFKMAEIYFGGIDADTITQKMSPFQRRAYAELKAAMVKWDTGNRLKMLNNSAVGERLTVSDRPDVVTW